MRRLALAVASTLAATALVLAGSVLAASFEVSLTTNGPAPENVTVNWGDTVAFANKGSATYEIAIPGLDVTSPPIAPGGSHGVTFTGRGGTFRFVQRGGARTHSGQVRVTVSGSVTLATGTSVVPFGQAVTLSGRSSFPGTAVVVSGRPMGAGGDVTTLLETTASADGTFSGRIRPATGLRLQARVAAGQVASRTLSMRVRPRATISLSPRTAPAGQRISVQSRVTPASAASRANLVVYDQERKRWTTQQSRPIPSSGRVAFVYRPSAGRTRMRVEVRSPRPGFVSVDTRVVTVVGVEKS